MGVVVVVKDIINLCCFEFKGIFGVWVFGGCFCVMVPGGWGGGTTDLPLLFFLYSPIYFLLHLRPKMLLAKLVLFFCSSSALYYILCVL